MEVKIEKITPSRAKSYLTQNAGNRNIRASHVKNLVRDMQSGAWVDNGETVKFNCDGTLIDGQHRLTAIVQTGIAIDTVVVRGIKASAVKTIDAGAKRTAADALHFGGGVKNANIVAAAARFAISVSLSETMRPVQVTNSEIVAFYEAHPDLEEMASRVMKNAPAGYPSTICAMAYIFQFLGHDVDDILNGWLYGDGSREYPCRVARERVMKDAISGRKLISQEKCRLVAHSMNLAIAGKEVSFLRVPQRVCIKGWTGSNV